MRDDFVAQAAQAEQLTRQQKVLEAKAATISKAQAKADAKAKTERERLQRLNNKAFARWLDNTGWAVRVFCTESRHLWLVAAIHWALFVPVGLFAVRVALSERCIQTEACRWIVRSVMEQPIQTAKSKKP